MTFTIAKPTQKLVNGTGISARLHARKDGTTTFYLTLNARFQEAHFGGDIVGKHIKIGYGTGSDAGQMQVEIVGDAEAETVATKSTNGAVKITCSGWSQLGKETQKTAPCHFVEVHGEGIVVRLPEWANGKEKLGKEFGLKPIKRVAV